MAIAKIILNGITKMDATGVTATASNIVSNYTAMIADGTIATGTYPGGVIVPHTWLGDNPELVQTYNLGTVALKDTGYATWTPNTTGNTIVNSSSLGTVNLDMENYEYIFVWITDTHMAYQSGASLKNAPIRQIYMLVQPLSRRPNTYFTLQSKNFAGNSYRNLFQSSVGTYYNASSAETVFYDSATAIYPSLPILTWSNATSYTPTLTVNSPPYMAKCHNTIFSTTSAAEVDQDNSTIKGVGYLYRVDRGTSTWNQVITELVDIYNS